MRICAGLSVAIAVALGAAGPASAGPQAVHPVKVTFTAQHLAQTFFDNAHVTAMVVGYVSGSTTAHELFYGKVRPQSTHEPNDRTIFQVGSISKTFTASVLASQVLAHERTYSDLLAPLVGVTLTANDPKTFITLEMLATHRAGLSRKPGNLPSYATYDPANPPSPLYNTADLFADFADPAHPLEHPPAGSFYQYSNYGYALLSKALAPDDGFEDLFTQRFATPLGMPDTTYPVTDITRMAKSKGHVLDEQFGVGPVSAGAGGYHSTLNDMEKWLIWNMGLGPSTVSDAIRKEATRIHATQQKRPGYNKIGLSWTIAQTRRTSGNHAAHSGTTTISKGGASPGFKSWIGWEKDTKNGVVIMVAGNVGHTDDEDAGGVSRLGEDILAALHG